MSMPRPRLDYALTVGPLLLAFLAFIMFHHCVPTVSGKYIKFCVFVYPAFSVDVIVLPGDPPRGIALAAPFPLTSDITVQLSCQFALLSVLKISTTIAVDRVRSGSTSRTLRVLHDSRCKRSSFHETTTVRLVDAIFFIFVYRQVVKRERIRLTDLLAFDRPIG
ncbi:hypothetical protein ALC60_04454 [Trachymyrmex zeteki]|uniref:Uncharacterized protein n=1 Tax=Mycetomoellerius zeteki TaxID=64791 RepID=A0A151X8D5_9HYME|nr:hypothetical protein ALC60_04454 [Trachymyrmex zeteki]